MADHIHIAGDGRGEREVYLNGRLVPRVTYANTRAGVLRHYDDPPKVHKHGKRFIQRTKRGVVEVRCIEGQG